MLYYILRPLTRIALKAYFRRITLNGLENLPLDKPVLLCSNHPTGFIEPCLLACFLPRTLHFLVRGDLFEKPVLKQILISTNQIPIFRFRDGYERLRTNRDVMNISYKKLAEGHAILIFPEASTEEVKYLRPVKKGAARMALETLKLHPEIDLSIVPIGINYSSPNRWRSYVNINIGEAITPELPPNEKLLPKEILTLTRSIETSLAELLLHKEKEVSNEKLNKALDMGQWLHRPKGALFRQKDEPEQFKYERKISEGLRAESDLSVSKNIPPPIHKFTERGVSFWNILISVIIAIPVFIILALNAIPVLIGVAIRDKYVGINEFIASIAIAASLGAYMILFPIAFIIAIWLAGWWALLLLCLPFLGLVGLLGLDYIRTVLYRIKLSRKLGREERKSNFRKGEEIINKLKS